MSRKRHILPKKERHDRCHRSPRSKKSTSSIRYSSLSRRSSLLEKKSPPCHSAPLCFLRSQPKALSCIPSLREDDSKKMNDFFDALRADNTYPSQKHNNPLTHRSIDRSIIPLTDRSDPRIRASAPPHRRSPHILLPLVTSSKRRSASEGVMGAGRGRSRGASGRPGWLLSTRSLGLCCGEASRGRRRRRRRRGPGRPRGGRRRRGS
mmetsp:Transcript_24313/g.78534  ORF Transcript_24313/g.78534 Transcript_24313/m.78534 type:complete len:207 (-) Transcript_24313:1085-1705(-)